MAAALNSVRTFSCTKVPCRLTVRVKRGGGPYGGSGFSLTPKAVRNTDTAHAQLQSTTKKLVCCAGRSYSEPVVAFFGNRDPDLTVAKLQVGVFGQVEQFQRELDRIAGLLDSDDEEAMGELVHDVVVMLSRNLEYCSYAQTALFMTDDFDELEQKYNQASLNERSKFKAETLSNVGGRYTTGVLRESGSDVGLDKWLCITLILAAEATVKLPKIRGLQDLRQSLSLLGSLSPEYIVAVELLWTPQERGDSYSKDEMLADYPKLALL